MQRSLIAILMCTAVACGGESAPEAAPCPAPVAVQADGDFPPGLDPAAFGVLTDFRSNKGFVQAKVISEQKVVEIYPPLARELLDGGYDILSGDNEGFEAEIFFARGESTGTYLLREGPCGNQVTLRLVYGKGTD